LPHRHGDAGPGFSGTAADRARTRRRWGRREDGALRQRCRAPATTSSCPNNSCGHCPSCREDEAGYCHDFFGYNFAGQRPDGTSPISKGDEVIHGNFFGQSSFATYALCHPRNVVKVRNDAPLDLLGPLACGVQTGAGAIINALKVGAGDSVAIFGAGSVGLSAVMAARTVGATTIVAVDLNKERLALAKKFGATHTIDGSDPDLVARVVEATGGGAAFAFDTTGVPALIRKAVDSLALRGECGTVAPLRSALK
jgi:aryl-alcohol dehydrogenase